MHPEMRSLHLNEFYDEAHDKVAKFSFRMQPTELKHDNVLVAAITSYYNTLIPSVMLGANIVAKKACELSLHVKFWIQSCTKFRNCYKIFTTKWAE